MKKEEARYRISVLRPPSLTPIWIADAVRDVEAIDYLKTPAYAKKHGDLLIAQNIKNQEMVYFWAYVGKRKIYTYGVDESSFLKVPSIYESKYKVDYGLAWNTAYVDMDAEDVLKVITYGTSRVALKTCLRLLVRCVVAAYDAVSSVKNRGIERFREVPDSNAHAIFCFYEIPPKIRQVLVEIIGHKEARATMYTPAISGYSIEKIMSSIVEYLNDNGLTESEAQSLLTATVKKHMPIEKMLGIM